jgi:hypothetical protein
MLFLFGGLIAVDTEKYVITPYVDLQKEKIWKKGSQLCVYADLFP